MMPHPLQLNSTLISFPYLNENATIDPVNRLLVDICEKSNSSNISNNSYTVSLKYAYSQYYSEYEQYLQINNKTLLQNEILLYYKTIIATPIIYKYKVGQFGYLLNGARLEDSFVCITELKPLSSEIFFLHSQLKKYKYILYDITSSKPKKSKKQSNINYGSDTSDTWMCESEFIPVNGICEVDPLSPQSGIMKLLNWKTYREDYLIRKLHEEKRANYMKNNNIINNVTSTDDTVDTVTEYYITEEEEEIEQQQPVVQEEQKDVVEKYGYNKENHLCYTLFGEIFTAWTFNTKTPKTEEKEEEKKEELVAIKKLVRNNNISNKIVIDRDLIREALILRRLKAKNTFLSNSIVNYIDFFEGSSDYYIVMEFNFNLNLKQFVDKSQEYIRLGRLSLNEYIETIKYLLWRLAATINFLHEKSYVKSCDLDICLENIMLSKAEFISKDVEEEEEEGIENASGAVGINLMIEIRMIDVSVRELLEISNYHKIKQFKSKYNEKYLENNKYLSPSLNDLCASDMWSVGIVVYYCFFGTYPSQLYNGKLNEELEELEEEKGLNEQIKSLLNGLLNLDERDRLKSIDVMQHPWFNSFYKAYLSICDKNYLNK